jgi:hypothetical protein
MPTGMTGSHWTVAGFTGTIGSITGTASSNIVADATVYSFTSGSGTFAVSAGAPVIVDYLVVGGGGGGGWNVGGGGGAGGLVYTKGVQLPVGAYTWTVGAGGAGASTAGAAIAGSSGANSSLSSTAFGNITALGGGGGGPQSGSGLTGGSAGGAGGNGTVAAVAGATGQGNSGGAMSATWSAYVGAGGGGAGNAGSQPSSTLVAGVGGSGLAIPITGSNVYYAGGGGGGNINANTPASGGLGGGGAGGAQSGTSGTTTKTDAVAGTANTGGGGGGAGAGGGTAGTALPSAGGSGVIILRVYTNTSSRQLIGDGSGYSMALSSQSNAVTTDIMTVTDQGNVSIGLSNALFSQPIGTVFDSSSNFYICDFGNHRIRKISPTGIVTTSVGNGLAASTTPGTGTGVSITNPFGIALDGSGNAYFTEYSGFVRKLVLSTGAVSAVGTIGSTNTRSALLIGTTLYVTCGVGTNISNISNITTTPSAAAQWVSAATLTTAVAGASPFQMAYDGSTYMYLAAGYAILRITVANGTTSLFAGSNAYATTDGTGTAARFNNVTGLCIDPTNSILYASEYNGHTIRKIVISTTAVTTIAGTAGTAGYLDATGLKAIFNYPSYLTIDSTGSNLYISDQSGAKIRKLNIPTSNVTTYAGTGAGGFADGSVPTTTVVNNTLLVSSIVGANCNAPYTLDVGGVTLSNGNILNGYNSIAINENFSNSSITTSPRGSSSSNYAYANVLTQSGWTWNPTVLGGISYSNNTFSSGAFSSMPSWYTAFLQVSSGTTTSTLTRTTTIPAGVTCRLSFWLSARSSQIGPNLTVAFGGVTIATINWASANAGGYYSSSSWNNFVYTFTPSVANQSLVFTATLAGGGTDESALISEVNISHTSVVHGLNVSAPATSLDVFGTAQITGAGTNNLNSNLQFYGPKYDTLTLKNPLGPYQGGITSLFFGNQLSSYPLARIYAYDTQPDYSGGYLGSLVFQYGYGTGLNEGMRINSSGATIDGNVLIGQLGFGLTYGGLQHYALATTGSYYAILQSNDGTTFLNAASGKRINFGIGNTYYANLTASGLRVGDTTVASYTLDVAGSAQIGGQLIVSSATGQALLVGSNVTTGANGAIRMTNSSGSNYIQSGSNFTGSTAAPLLFTTMNGGAEWARFDATGKFGINCNAPAMQLDVAGQAKIGGNTGPHLTVFGPSSPGGGYIQLSNISSGNFWKIYGPDGGNTLYITNPGGTGVTLANGGTSWGTSSDSRLKTVIEPVSNATSAFEAITPVYYTLNACPDGRRRIGVIAQEVSNCFPEVVDIVTDGTYSVRYSELVSPLIAAIKELSARLSNVEAKLVATTTA